MRVWCGGRHSSYDYTLIHIHILRAGFRNVQTVRPFGRTEPCKFSASHAEIEKVMFLFVDIFLHHCSSPLCNPRAVESSPLQFFGASVTNLNEPPRSLAVSTIAWVRSCFLSSLLGRCIQNQRGLRALLCRWPSITE